MRLIRSDGFPAWTENEVVKGETGLAHDTAWYAHIMQSSSGPHMIMTCLLHLNWKKDRLTTNGRPGRSLKATNRYDNSFEGDCSPTNRIFSRPAELMDRGFVPQIPLIFLAPSLGLVTFNSMCESRQSVIRVNVSSHALIRRKYHSWSYYLRDQRYNREHI